MKLYKLLILAIVLTFIGCASQNPLKRYPDFVTQKELIYNFSLMTDLVIYKSGKKDTVIIDINNNRQIGAILSNSIKESLYNKGYAVEKILPTSVGRFFKNDVYAKIIENKNQQNLKYDQLPLKNAPFFIDSTDYDSLLTNLFANEKVNEDNKNYEYTNQSNINPIIVLEISGENVSAGKSIGEGILTGLLTLGTVSVYSVSHVIIKLYIVDTQTRKVLWYDWSDKKGQDPNEKYLIKGVNSLIKKIPDKL